MNTVLEHRLRMLEKDVLRKISGSEWAEIKKDWRNILNEWLRDSQYSSYIIIMIKCRRLAAHVALIAE
jgi:hypothetical protein